MGSDLCIVTARVPVESGVETSHHFIEQCISVLEKSSAINISDDVRSDVRIFFTERLRHFYINQGVAHDVFNAADILAVSTLSDLDDRIQATEDFKQQDYAKSLIEANKRATNIVAKAESPQALYDQTVNASLFESQQESDLYEKIKSIESEFEQLVTAKKYSEAYHLLSTLAQPLDVYFEQVMVNVDDDKIRMNRLSQLAQVSRLTGSIADLSQLVKG